MTDSNTTLVRTLAELRVVVGFLGEQGQFGWWRSAFFSSSSEAFLAPVFARTKVLARFTGVTQAAALVHDERIGVGHVYHLFRLPEDMEQSLHQHLLEPGAAESMMRLTSSRPEALAHLSSMADKPDGSGVGPTLVGGLDDLRLADAWRKVACLYRGAFTADSQTLPYFADRG